MTAVASEKGTYRVSEETRSRLIHAAGELFALRGVEAVTVREIADKADAVPNAVRYHFGDKAGLVAAVEDFALTPWRDGKLQSYCAENDSLYATRDGCRQMVADAIDIFYAHLMPEGQPMWAAMFLLRALLTSQWLGKEHEEIAKQSMECFCRIFQKVTGNDDHLSAVCWSMAIISPGMIFSSSTLDYTTMNKSGGVNYTFLRRLQTTVTRNALLALGLGDDLAGRQRES